MVNGNATGSRLISGNHKLYQEAADYIAQFHETDAALLFNSGYDANVGFFGVSHKGSHTMTNYVTLQLETVLSFLMQNKYAHNDFQELETLLKRSMAKRILLPSVFQWMVIRLC
jgi:8-amino-7-oxononanoate synthase